MRDSTNVNHLARVDSTRDVLDKWHRLKYMIHMNIINHISPSKFSVHNFFEMV